MPAVAIDPSFDVIVVVLVAAAFAVSRGGWGVVVPEILAGVSAVTAALSGANPSFTEGRSPRVASAMDSEESSVYSSFR